MTSTEIIAIITSVLAPMSAMFSLYMRETIRARVRSEAQVVSLQKLDAKMSRTNVRLERIEEHLGIVVKPVREEGEDATLQ